MAGNDSAPDWRLGYLRAGAPWWVRGTSVEALRPRRVGVRRGTVYFLLILVFLALIFFRKRDKDISEGIRISLEE